MPRYRIFPSIGIARLGQDKNFFLGPEIPGSGPMELNANGSLAPVTKFKDASNAKLRKQGARFHIFESNDGVNWIPARLGPDARITWKVTLMNKKSAVQRSIEPPIRPQRPQVIPSDQSMVIDGGTQTISGPHSSEKTFIGHFSTRDQNGNPYNAMVELGSVMTDGEGRLIVLGGNGFSSAPAGTPIGNSYYKNPKWHDDVADGPITAEISLSPNSPPVLAEEGAWVIIGPPDYAPNIDCIVTLYDVLQDIGMRGTFSDVTSFDRDIAPLIVRVRRLRWVHEDAGWTRPELERAELRSKLEPHRPLREAVAGIIRSVEESFSGHTNAAGPAFKLRQFQKTHLDRWESGNFDDSPNAPEGTVTASGLTKAALDATAGQGFCPGIEAGLILLDPTIYISPFDFRISHSSLSAGDITALMAQPWQADFLKCNTEWWPTQRPDIAPQITGQPLKWARGVAGLPDHHRLMVNNFSRLGFIVKQGIEEVFLESERDPTL